MQERLESGRVGRLLISVFVIVTIGAMIVWNMPDSTLRREGMRFAEPYVTAVGLDQSWDVFAPNPYRESFRISVRVTHADGTADTWTVPAGDDAIGELWDYRWGKWEEWTAAGVEDLCEGTALYAAERVAGEGRHPMQVRVVARRRPNSPPGDEPSHGAWKESTVCTVDVRAARDQS